MARRRHGIQLLVAAAAAASFVFAEDPTPPSADEGQPLDGSEQGARKHKGPEIEHVVLLMMENRPFDFFFGFAGLPGADDLSGKTRCNFFNVSNHSQGQECVASGKANYVCKDASAMSFKIYDDDIFGPGVWDGISRPYPNVSEYGTGYLQTNRGNNEIMWQMSPEQIPVKMALAREFAVFDNWHSSFPGPSTPNHLFAQTATSRGCTETGATYHCKPGALFPQKTIYESLVESGKTWRYFYNDSAWNSFLEFFHTPQGQDGMRTYDEFYDRASKGTLPSFSWVLPRQGVNKSLGKLGYQNDDHPCHDIRLGERLLKDTYEAVRAGPGWNKTVMIVTYDDAGGWYDHAGAAVGVPTPDDDEASCPDKTDFTWTGARVPTMLISPLVPKGKVIHNPSGPAPDSIYEHSSIPATLKDIFNLPSFLTKRDAWAGSFLGELTEREPRTDAPMHLPDAPEPPDDMTSAQHCSALARPPCGADERTDKKQKQRMRQWAEINGVELPDLDATTRTEADEWITAQYEAFRSRLVGEL